MVVFKKKVRNSGDAESKPMVLVGRLQPAYQPLIPAAILYAKRQLGKPYNSNFAPNHGQSFYCSQLIYAAFASANHNHSIFGLNTMSFTDSQTRQITPAWKEYFIQIKSNPPQGKPGTNPGMMSRESGVIIEYAYGKLRVHAN